MNFAYGSTPNLSIFPPPVFGDQSTRYCYHHRKFHQPHWVVNKLTFFIFLSLQWFVMNFELSHRVRKSVQETRPFWNVVHQKVNRSVGSSEYKQHTYLSVLHDIHVPLYYLHHSCVSYSNIKYLHNLVIIFCEEWTTCYILPVPDLINRYLFQMEERR